MGTVAVDDVKAITSVSLSARHKVWLEEERQRRGLRSVSAVMVALIEQAMAAQERVA